MYFSARRNRKTNKHSPSFILSHYLLLFSLLIFSRRIKANTFSSLFLSFFQRFGEPPLMLVFFKNKKKSLYLWVEKRLSSQSAVGFSTNSYFLFNSCLTVRRYIHARTHTLIHLRTHTRRRTCMPRKPTFGIHIRTWPTLSQLWNYDVSELNKIRWSPDFDVLKLWKGRLVGRKKTVGFHRKQEQQQQQPHHRTQLLPASHQAAVSGVLHSPVDLFSLFSFHTTSSRTGRVFWYFSSSRSSCTSSCRSSSQCTY